MSGIESLWVTKHHPNTRIPTKTLEIYKSWPSIPVLNTNNNMYTLYHNLHITSVNSQNHTRSRKRQIYIKRQVLKALPERFTPYTFFKPAHINAPIFAKCITSEPNLMQRAIIVCVFMAVDTISMSKKKASIINSLNNVKYVLYQ